MPLRAKTGFSAAAVLLILLVAAVSVINLSWIIKDTRPQAFQDPYPQRILKFSHQFAKDGFKEFPRLINWLSVGPRPPLYQLLAVPCVYAFGRTEDAILVVNIISGIILILAAYGAGRLAGGRGAGLLAALIVATYPPLVNLSKIARPHSIAPASVALYLWLLLLLIRTRSPRVFWLFGASIGMGLLVHPNLMYILPAPSIFWVLYLVFFQTVPSHPPHLRGLPRWIADKLRDPLVARGLIPAIIISIGLPAVWYIPRMTSILELVHRSAEVWSSVRLGFPDVPASFWWYALTMPGAISIVFTLLLAVSLLVVILRPRIYSTVVAITFILGYIGISMRKGALAWMNGAAILPLAAVLTAVGLTGLNNIFQLSPRAEILKSSSSRLSAGIMVLLRRIGRFLSLLLLVVCVIVAGFNFSVVTWGIPPHCEGLVRALGAPLYPSCGWRMVIAFYPNPPRKEDWRMSDLLRLIVADSEGGKEINSLVIVSNYQEGMKYSALRYYLTRDFPKFKMKIDPVQVKHKLGPPTLNWLSSKYLVYIPGLGRGHNSYIRAVEKFLEQSPEIFKDAHEEIGVFQLPDGTTAHLIKRTRDLTLEEAEISIGALKYLKKDIKKQLLNRARTLLVPIKD